MHTAAAGGGQVGRRRRKGGKAAAVVVCRLSGESVWWRLGGCTRADVGPAPYLSAMVMEKGELLHFEHT